MQKLWLRGVLLGVSLALLLAGGVALAQGLSITADRDCFECEPLDRQTRSANLLPDFAVEFWIQVMDSPFEFCFDFWLDGDWVRDWCHPSRPYFYMFAWCGEEVVFSGLPPQLVPEVDVGATDAILPFEYGEWTVGVCEPNTGGEVGAQASCAETSVVLAEDCSAYEFVPEPGTIALLGSGLAGLAGYATLRWRTRE